MWVEEVNISKNEWDIIIKNNDGDFKQTYGWGEFKKVFDWKIIRLIYLENNNIKSAVQVFYKKKIKIVAIFIPGQIINDCKIKNKQLLEKIYDLFRGNLIYIRLHSNTFFDNDYYESLIQNNWKNPYFSKSPNNLICIKKLSSKLELISSYKQKWRYNLKKANKEKCKIVISKNINQEQILELVQKHENLKKSNKNYKHSKNHFSKLDQYFPNQILNIEAVNDKNQLISSRIFILFNNCAWNYMNLTSDEATTLQCNYLMLHKAAEFLIDMKIEKINLGELNLRDFPGVFQFKTGFEKRECKIIGELSHSNNKILSLLIEILLKNKFNIKKNIYDFIFTKFKI